MICDEWPNKALEPYALLLAPRQRPVPIERVRVALRQGHDRTPHASDAMIEVAWQSKLAKAQATGGKLFDLSKFRLHHIAWASSDGDTIEIALGLTSYKEYIGTNLRPEPERARLEADGARCDPSQGARRASSEDGGGGGVRAHLSNALGCEAMLVTSDGAAVLLRRSGAVATGTGLYNGPSGHPEPSHAILTAAEKLDDRRALAELFGSILQEVCTEGPLTSTTPYP